MSALVEDLNSGMLKTQAPVLLMLPTGTLHLAQKIHDMLARGQKLLKPDFD